MHYKTGFGSRKGRRYHSGCRGQGGQSRRTFSLLAEKLRMGSGRCVWSRYMRGGAQIGGPSSSCYHVFAGVSLYYFWLVCPRMTRPIIFVPTAVIVIDMQIESQVGIELVTKAFRHGWRIEEGGCRHLIPALGQVGLAVDGLGFVKTGALGW